MKMLNNPYKLRVAFVNTVVALLLFYSTKSFANTWTNSSGGLWTAGVNWLESLAPNGTDAVADFSSSDMISDLIVNLDAPQTVGALIFGDADTNTPAAWILGNNGNAGNILTLEVSSGQPAIMVTNQATITARLAGVSGLGKGGVGTLVISSATYSGQTTVSNGTLVLGAANLLSTNDDLWLGSQNVPSKSMANLNLSNFVQSVNNLATVGTVGVLDENLILTTNNVTTNIITIASGKTLRVQRNALFSFMNANGIYTNIVIFTGGGAFVQKLDEAADPNTPINFQVGADNLSSGQTGPRATVDMSGLASADINLGTNNTGGIVYYPNGAPSLAAAWAGSLIVGDVMKSGAGGELCSLILASNTTVTANALIVGFARAAGYVNTLVLGSGSNVFNVNTNSLAAPPGLSGREGGRMFFSSPTGSLKIRAQDGVGRANFYVAGTQSSNPGRSLANGLGMSSEQYADLTGHYADLLLSTLVVGDERHGNFTLPPQAWTNYFSFSQGILDSTDLRLGLTRGSVDGTNYYLNTCNLLGGSVAIGSNGITMAQIMVNSANPASPAGRQYLYTNDTTLNIGGGTVKVGGNIVAALQNSTNQFYVFSTINITNGSLSVTGNIYCGKPTTIPTTSPLALRVATLTLNGGILDLTGHAIGSNPSGATVTNHYMDRLNFLSGTLRNVSQINNGTTKLIKTGSGTLVLTGINGYTAGTVVSNGVLDVKQDDALGLGDVRVASGGVLQLNSGVANRYINPGARLLLDSGAGPVNLGFAGVPNNIAGLSFDGGATFQATGTWGSSASGATHQDDTHFSGTGTLLVTAPANIALSSSENPVNYGQSVTLTATVTGGVGVPTGFVVFMNGNTALATNALNGAGVAFYTSSLLPSGNNLITANYGGNNSYSPVTSSVLSQQVQVIPIQVSGGNLVLQYDNSIVGTNYVLVSSFGLEEPVTWTPVITNAGTGGVLTFTVPFNTGTPKQFFRYLFQ